MTNDKITTMLDMQTLMNRKIHSEWHAQKFKWTRAIMVEGVEALEHYGWKWWKKQEPDLVQFRIELVDIWHFILSHELVDNDMNAERVAGVWAYHFSRPVPGYLLEGDVRVALELLIGRAASGEVHRDAFLALLSRAGMDFDDLYAGYVSKNVLNMFRQANGYKEGTYIKLWNGREDNEILAEYVARYPDITPAELEKALTATYAKVKSPVAA